jgi:tetratricopeptide (TPR) repeat protein
LSITSTLGGLGLACAALGETHKALLYYEQTLAIARETGDRRDEGLCLFNMSLSRYQLDERKQALANAEAALKILEEAESPFAEKVRRRLAEWRAAPRQ